jgi:hypothetical protein
MGTYLVKPGDSLYKIAGKLTGVANRWRELPKLNPVLKGPDWKIYPNQSLTLPLDWPEIPGGPVPNPTPGPKPPTPGPGPKPPTPGPGPKPNPEPVQAGMSFGTKAGITAAVIGIAAVVFAKPKKHGDKMIAKYAHRQYGR